ncbi:MAG: hypothetical protein L6264_12755 [Weeksellaceae bacterium]|nr:hypothetical protein [Bacteroidota bacterium]MCG2781808.1 hypothetical protein [Weeksellaceae bacterium]
MNLTIEIEKKEDYPFIKKLLERLKGVKIVSNEYEMIEGVPAHVFEAIEKYGENLKEEDLISKEEFFKFIDDEICRLNSQK